MTSDRVIGFAGLGAMGLPMAENIAKAGHALAVFDLDGARAATFSDRAQICLSPADLADKADIVFLCLPTLQSHLDILEGPQGLLGGRRMRSCVITGTVGPACVRDLEAKLGAHQIATVDAPMTGGRLRAAAGTLTVMLSGPPDARDAARSIIEAYSNKVVLFGEETGQAQTMKLLNNIMSATNLVIALEALVFGSKAGLDPEQILEVVNNGTGKNELTHTVVPHSVLTRDFNFGSSMATVVKDMTAAIDEAERLGAPVALTRVIQRLFKEAGKELGENEDQTHLMRYLEKQAGTEVAKTR